MLLMVARSSDGKNSSSLVVGGWGGGVGGGMRGERNVRGAHSRSTHEQNMNMTPNEGQQHGQQRDGITAASTIVHHAMKCARASHHSDSRRACRCANASDKCGPDAKTCA
jgi:hypothetical protein